MKRFLFLWVLGMWLVASLAARAQVTTTGTSASAVTNIVRNNALLKASNLSDVANKQTAAGKVGIQYIAVNPDAWGGLSGASPAYVGQWGAVDLGGGGWLLVPSDGTTNAGAWTNRNIGLLNVGNIGDATHMKINAGNSYWWINGNPSNYTGHVPHVGTDAEAVIVLANANDAGQNALEFAEVLVTNGIPTVINQSPMTFGTMNSYAPFWPRSAFIALNDPTFPFYVSASLGYNSGLGAGTNLNKTLFAVDPSTSDPRILGVFPAIPNVTDIKTAGAVYAWQLHLMSPKMQLGTNNDMVWEANNVDGANRGPQFQMDGRQNSGNQWGNVSCGTGDFVGTAGDLVWIDYSHSRIPMVFSNTGPVFIGNNTFVAGSVSINSGFQLLAPTVTITNGFTVGTNSTAPNNTSIIRAWVAVTNGGSVFKMPLYQ